MYYKIGFYILKITTNIKIIFDIIRLILKKDLSFPIRWWIILEFEKKCTSFFSVKYALLVNNWTSALYSSFYSISGKIDINNCLQWREIICPSYTWWASILPATNLWAKICFIDIDSNNLSINIDSLKRAINKNTIAVLVPHLWWEMSNIQKIIKIAKEKKIYVIEDASHCFWTSLNWKMLWTFWDIWIFSLQANKPVTWWEWWLIVTNNNIFYEKSVLIWHYERISNLSDKYYKYLKTWLWFKFRIHPISACMANINLKNINYRAKLENLAMNYIKNELKKIWITLIRTDIDWFIRGPQFWYKLIIDFIPKNKKEDFFNICKAEKIPIEAEYFSMLDKELIFKDNSYTENNLPNLRKIYNNLYTLKPINYLDKNEIETMIRKLKIILNKII